jgi:pimeloyl-ACP methyl ester carboxylesterase
MIKSYFFKRSLWLLFLTSFFNHCVSGQQKITSTFEWATCPNCPRPDIDTAILRKKNLAFGYLTVPENRSDMSDGRKLRLSVAVLKSQKSNSGALPIVIIHGGPGGRIVGFLSGLHEQLAKDRDVIFIDQRGCGTSEPDFSPEMNQEILEILAKDLSPVQEMKERTMIAARARDKLIQRGINLSSYNSREIAADINDLCKLLGYKSWDLWGSSYGTRIALTMMRDFPEGIHSVILESPLPPNVRYFENVTANFRRSLDKIFAKCENDPSCKKAYPELKKDFYEAIDSLDKNPMIISMKDHKKFPDGKFIINSQDMLLAFQQALYAKEIYPVLPILIEQIKNRNENALQSFAENMANGIFRLDYGTYYTVICRECMPFNNIKNFEDSSAGFWQGLSFYKDEFSICKIWNQSIPDSVDAKPVSSNIPALILSGEIDPIAPPSYAEMVQKNLSKSFLYTFENTGHFVADAGHSFDLIKKFLNDPSTEPDSLHFIKAANIPFASQFHPHVGITLLAPKLRINEKNILYNTWIGLIGFFSLMTLFILVREFAVIERRSNLSGKEKLFYGFGIISTILAIFFMALLILVILKTAKENYFLLGFGLPARYSTVLFVPYLIFGFYVFQLLIWMFDKSNSRGKGKYLLFFLMQIPFISLIFYFHLFY